MKIKSIFLIIITFLITSSAFSQQKGKYMASIYYSVGFPIGRTSDFISDPSWSGVSFDGKQFISSNTALGLWFGWNVWSKNESGTTQFSQGNVSGAVTGNTAKYYNVLPLLASVTFFPNTARSAKTKFYMAGYVGAYSFNQQLEIGVNTFENNNWHFGLAPELGIYFQVARTTNITLSGRYNYAFSSGEALNGDESNEQSWINVNLGLGFNSW